MTLFGSLPSGNRAVSILQQVSTLAKLKPDAVALSAGEARMSYGELDGRSGREVLIRCLGASR